MPITTTRFKCGGGEPRPRCALCGKAYGQRHTGIARTWLRPDEEMPRYTGNQMLVEETVQTGWGRTDPDTGKHVAGTMVRRVVWDGTWRGGYEPFCALVCALSFARAAHRDGARYTLKAEG
jgi:hypothetical protein